MTSPTPLADSPSYTLPAYHTMQARWQLVRDVRGGTAVLREKKATYLPRFEAEDPRDWTTRVNLTFAYDALDQALAAMIGLAFRTEPELGEDVPASFRPYWENLDGEGTHGTVFAQQCLDSALQDGHCLILTEYPTGAAGMIRPDREAQGIRPYLVRVPIDQVRSWRVGTWGGRRLLTQLVIGQPVERPEGEYRVTTVIEYRVFRQLAGPEGPSVAWETWVEDRTAATRTAAGVLGGVRFIPVAPVFGGQRVGYLESLPPLLGLAYSNIDHTQVKSDRRFSMHKCALPIPVFIGRLAAATTGGGSDVVMSSSRGIDISVGGDAKILEPQGTALDALRQELLDIEQRMAQQGLALVLPQDGAAKTAREVGFLEARQESKLARAVRSLQDALEASLGFMAAYEGLPDGGSVVLRRDFSALTLTDADQQTLTAARERGDLTLETFLSFVRLRGGLFETLDPVQEAARVREEMGVEGMGLEDEPQTEAAVQALDAAIARHERHLNGTEATSPASQEQMMREMEAARKALRPGEGMSRRPDGRGGHGAGG